MAERRKTDKQLESMSVDDLLAHARKLDAEMDERRDERDAVQRALSERIEAGDVPAYTRPSADDEKEG